MRTKTLLLTAALGLAGLSASMAQVYSVNIVGYYNRTIPAGQFALLANQLKNGTNGLDQIISGSHEGDAVYLWTGTGWSGTVPSFIDGVGWDPTAQVPPGTGFFYKNNSATAVTLTFVGEVSTGSLTNALAPNFSLKGPIVPQGGDIEAVHSLSGNEGDSIYQWTGTGWSGTVPSYIVGVGWDPAAVVSVGEGFFYKNTGATIQWARTFNP